MAGCSTPWQSLPPTSVASEQYQDMTCDRLKIEKARLTREAGNLSPSLFPTGGEEQRSPSRPETYRVKLFAKSGPRAKVLARTIHPNADCISYLNGDGLDNRRHNLKPTNGTEIQRERRAREKTAKAKKGSRKVLAKAA